MLKIEGLLRAGEDHVELEYHTTDRSLQSGDPTTVRIPIDRLDAVECVQRFFTTTLRLTGRDLDVFGDIPGSDNSTLTLRIGRPDRVWARQLAELLHETLTERRMQ